MSLICLVMTAALTANPAEPGQVDLADLVRREVEADWVRRDRRFTSHARTSQTPAAQPAERRRNVGTAEDAAGGCDGVKNGRWGFHTASNERDPWWQVDLGRPVRLDRVVVYNRTDGHTASRTARLQVLVSQAPAANDFQLVYQHRGQPFYGLKDNRPLIVELKDRQITARVVRLAVPGRCSFALDEVEVYGTDDPQKNLALGRPADQKSVDEKLYAGKTGKKVAVGRADAAKPIASSAALDAEFRLAHTREVLDRARGLAGRIRLRGDPAKLALPAGELDQLERRLAELEQAAETALPQRRDLYFEACRLARRIAFANPALDFDKLLFIKRRHPGGLFHMVHQFYGFNAKPGGGLYALAAPFSEHPKLIDLLADSVVTRGRLKGQRLDRGAFLSPELSFDARTIFFAYAQCQADGVEWSPRASFHLFKMAADGTGLEQLTDGNTNDFDPCLLPNGRVAFISERRGGYLRCGGSSPPYHSPTYTLHSMAADGSGVVCLSFHETHEWQPSVDHNGMLIYTRWDYVDRDTNAAHHLWTCYPDGRDPRSFHGNYPRRREDRPWMEMDIRAVPGSPKYVATAGAHHGVALGSLVLIDPRIEDDGAMSQVMRLTPEVPLPEAEGGGAKQVRQYCAYGTPWPLSEDDYLCAYGSIEESHGLWWIDRFGNRELIYRDPAIPSLSPIPLRARPVPPVLPDGTRQSVARQAADPGPASTIALMNVYDSDFTWPAGTKIKSLRIVQVLPKSTPRVNTPRIGVATGTNARAVLGTVPVETDGSAYFEAPAGKAIYFQALDEQGTAVQSMRSATYVHPGEQLVCRGCHEDKYRSAPARSGLPIALGRPPSPIQPDVDGSRPFNFVRLVQPVLDRHCLACHREKRASDLSANIEPGSGWTRSYQSLAPKYGFYFHSGRGSIGGGAHGGSRTTAGQFGARASRLLDYLDQRHYGVKLGDDDFHRIALWLDCNSEFYGAYEETAAQSRGQTVHPSIE